VSSSILLSHQGTSHLSTAMGGNTHTHTHTKNSCTVTH